MIKFKGKLRIPNCFLRSFLSCTLLGFVCINASLLSNWLSFNRRKEDDFKNLPIVRNIWSFCSQWKNASGLRNSLNMNEKSWYSSSSAVLQCTPPHNADSCSVHQVIDTIYHRQKHSLGVNRKGRAYWKNKLLNWDFWRIRTDDFTNFWDQ